MRDSGPGATADKRLALSLRKVVGMAYCYEFKGFIPVVPEDTYVHPQAVLIGNVILGHGCYIGPGASLRGDFGRIVIGDGANVQEVLSH